MVNSNDEKQKKRVLTRQQWAIIRQRERAKTIQGYLPQFRFNHHRGHFSYIYGFDGIKYKSIILTDDEFYKKDANNVKRNVLLYRHPNPNKPNDKQYVINKIFSDAGSHFDKRKKENWRFHVVDKRKIKRIIQRKWK